MPDPIEVDTPLQVKLSSSRSVEGLAAAHKGICLHAKMRGSPDGEIRPRRMNGARPKTLGGCTKAGWETDSSGEGRERPHTRTLSL
jgi:hypothetical protein